MRIFFSVGEPSGDVHGANLIRELRSANPQVECVGYGGPRMQEAGGKLHADLTKFAVMWFLRVLLNIHHFWRLYRQANAYFREHSPSAVVLIDYPGFNWWIARAAKRHGIPVFYYGAPQIWAWARWRIKKMRSLVDHVLCKLPFEEQWYSNQDCNAIYVGHPFFDETAGHQSDCEFLQQQQQQDHPLVTILPGSRTQEVKSNLHWFLRAAEVVHEQVPATRFAVASFDEKQGKLATEILAKHNGEVPVEIIVAKTPELIQLATCCMACSGSVSLELLYYEKPTVVLYWISRAAYFAQKFFRKAKYITLVNLFATDDPFPKVVTTFDPSQPEAESVPFPEYLTCEDKSRQVASHVIQWLSDKRELDRSITMLRNVKMQVAQPGASRRAANYILTTLAQGEAISAPHFRLPSKPAPSASSSDRPSSIA